MPVPETIRTPLRTRRTRRSTYHLPPFQAAKRSTLYVLELTPPC